MWDSNTPPSRLGLDIWSVKFAGLDICGWPNNNHRIGSDTILELSGPNSTPKVSLWGEGCPSTYKDYLCHILKRYGTLTPSSTTSHAIDPQPISVKMGALDPSHCLRQITPSLLTCLPTSSCPVIGMTAPYHHATNSCPKP